jgi:ABC-2 type transport system permease protein
MADLAESSTAPLTAHGGPLSPLARSQYRALASIRWSIFRNTIRTGRGALEATAHGLSYLIYALMGLGLGMGFGSGAYAIAATGKWAIVPVLFWALLLAWQVVPVSIASFQEQFDVNGLLRFPVGFGAFYLLHLIFGMVDISTILGGFCCLGILVGTTIVRPDLFGWVAFGLTVFAVFNILLVRAISAWTDRWMAQRRTREIVGSLFFLGLISLQLLNPAFRNETHSRESWAAAMRRFETVNRVQRWLPPGLAAEAVEQGAAGKPATAVGAIGLLGLYMLATGGALGVRLRAEYRGENFGDAPSRGKELRRNRAWLIDGSGPIAAVMEKELRVLLRAMPLIYGLAAPLLMVFIFSGIFIRRGTLGGLGAGQPYPMSLLISLAYALVGFTQLFYNSLGPEGPGIQVLFLSPTPIRTVILAKNLFHGILFLVDAALVCFVASLRMGWPSPAAVAAAGAWLLFALPVHLAAGNAFSINMPYRMNLGRLTRQRGSQANTLLSMLIQAGVLGVGVSVFALCSLFGRLWLAVAVFLILAAGAVFAWLRVLAHIDAMANQQRESLIATLCRTE